MYGNELSMFNTNQHRQHSNFFFPGGEESGFGSVGFNIVNKGMLGGMLSVNSINYGEILEVKEDGDKLQ